MDYRHADSSPITILCVDDEIGVLQALKRLLAADGYRVLLAPSAADGLAILSAEHVDIVIADMRMPDVDGATFLAEVRTRWPIILRILLTGQSSITDAIAAINQGEIYRYLTKPWDNDELRLVLRHATERQLLAYERDRLLTEVHLQNEALRTLNSELEARVDARTTELRHEHNRVLIANEKLKTGFTMAVKVFSSLIELGETRFAGHAQRVTELTLRIAERLEVERDPLRDIEIAALLHDIGMIGMPDSVKYKPYADLSPAQLEQLKQHSATGSMVLMAVEELRPAAKILRAHHERYDGLGYPDGLRGEEIPLGARILAVANDFDALMIGMHEPNSLDEDRAAHKILEGAGKRYDPRVVDQFENLMQSGASGLILGKRPPIYREVTVNPEQLEPGMVISRDLLSGNGVLMLHREHVLDSEMIGLIREYARSEDDQVVIHIDGDRVPP